MPTQGQGKRRTVDESGEEPVKRTRVSRACDQCRTAREKCDGMQPTCSTCSVSNRRCAYTASPKKRGIQPGYIRSLELALALLFQQNPDNETTLNQKLSQGGASSLFLSRYSKEATKLHKRWRKARFYSEVDRLLSGGEPSRHEQNDAKSPSSDDEDSESDQARAAIVTHHLGSTNPIQDIRSARESHVQSDLQRPYQTAGSDLVVMPSDSWSLFSTYFTYTHAWLPICEKHDILKLSYSYPEEGIALATVSAETGSHAELWSILTVASLYKESSHFPSCQSRQSPKGPTQQYDIARSLIPTEQGRFDLGHVKALLNLALFNIMLLHPHSAWLLVGYASRVLETVNSPKLLDSPRRKHVFAGCFLLDSLLATQLNRRPHFERRDLKRLGAIDEDGLEEWQPWYGHSSSLQQMRTPMLSLSTLNSLLDLFDIFANGESESESESDMNNRITSWESTLPSKLGYIHSEIPVAGLCPPAGLLQFAYYCALFAANPSAQGLERVLHVLEHYKKLIGFKSVPPLVQCLLGIIEKKKIHHVVGESTLAHFRKLQDELASIWSYHTKTKPMPGFVQANSHWSSAVDEAQFLVPEPQSILLPTTQPSRAAQHTLSGYEALHPNARTASTPPLAVTRLAATDARNPDVNSDLENLFDELASLDSTNRMDTQPQFLQKLGFAPDASMADVFSEYIPTQSAAFVEQEEVSVSDLDPYTFYSSVG